MATTGCLPCWRSASSWAPGSWTYDPHSVSSIEAFESSLIETVLFCVSVPSLLWMVTAASQLSTTPTTSAIVPVAHCSRERIGLKLNWIVGIALVLSSSRQGSSVELVSRYTSKSEFSGLYCFLAGLSAPLLIRYTLPTSTRGKNFSHASLKAHSLISPPSASTTSKLNTVPSPLEFCHLLRSPLFVTLAWIVHRFR